MKIWTFCLALLLAACGQSVSSASLSNGYTVLDARDGARLRAEAQILVSILFDPCQQVGAYAELEREYEEFGSSLPSDEYRVDLAIVESDYQYEASLIDIVCAEMNAEQQSDFNAGQIEFGRSILDRMKQAVNTGDI